MKKNVDKLSHNWSLFLDRDGVINQQIVDGYVTIWEEFRFLPGVLEAMSLFSSLFSTIIIVTNQQGIGKSLFTEEDLNLIHHLMIDKIQKAGGRVDAIYHCSSLKSTNDPNRKPSIGMGLKAKADFPDIDFSKSFMVGDSQSDMMFGRKLGMRTIFIKDEFSPYSQDADSIDQHYPKLIDFAKSLIGSWD